MVQKSGTFVPASEREYVGFISKALHADLGGSARATKTICRWTGVSDRTARNWLSAEKGPNGRHLIMLARHSPSVWYVILTMSDRRGAAVSENIRVAEIALHKALAELAQLSIEPRARTSS